MTSSWRDYPKTWLWSTVEHTSMIHVSRDDKENKLREGDGAFYPGVSARTRDAPWCVDHSWQMLSAQSNTLVTRRIHYLQTFYLQRGWSLPQRITHTNPSGIHATHECAHTRKHTHTHNDMNYGVRAWKPPSMQFRNDIFIKHPLLITCDCAHNKIH